MKTKTILLLGLAIAALCGIAVAQDGGFFFEGLRPPIPHGLPFIVAKAPIVKWISLEVPIQPSLGIIAPTESTVIFVVPMKGY